MLGFYLDIVCFEGYSKFLNFEGDSGTDFGGV